MSKSSKDQPSFEFVELEDERVNENPPIFEPKGEISSNIASYSHCFRYKAENASTEPKNIGRSVDNPTYTVEEAVEEAGFGRYQIMLCFICGVLMAADAMEMLLLSILGPALRCQWQLSSTEIAAITTVVFVGFLIGSPFWGYVSDKYGRWATFFTVLALISYFGFLTALSPDYWWIVILRFMVGFAIGGGSSSFALLSEFLPVKYRAKVLLAIQIFWAMGSTFEVGLAFLILPRFGWRWLVFASAIPLALFLILLKWLPESPRYLVTAGFTDKAEIVIHKLFKANRKEPPMGHLISSNAATRELGHFRGLFTGKLRSTTLKLPFIWFGAAFLYYGVVLLSAEIFRFRHYCFGDWGHTPDFYSNWTHGAVGSSVQAGKHLDTSCCQELTNDDFVTMIISSIGEFINVPLMVLVIDCFGRRITMGVWNGLSGLIFFLLYVCMSKEAMTGVLFVVRAFSAGLLSIAYLYTTEVYPTAIRAMAVGIFSSIARLGAITTPYVAQVMMPEVSQIGALSLYAGVGVICCILSLLLTIETSGRVLTDSYEEDAVEYTKES